MNYIYNYLYFGNFKPTEDEIKQGLRVKRNELDFVIYPEETSLNKIAGNIIKSNAHDWELSDGEDIYIVVYPDGRPDETELFNVKVSMNIDVFTSAVCRMRETDES